MQIQKTKTDSNTKRIRFFCSGRGKGLKSKDAINADQRRQLVQIPWSHGRDGKSTSELKPANRSMELIPVLGNFYKLK